MQAPRGRNVCLIGFICYAFPRPPIHVMKTIKPLSAALERQISWEQILSSVEDGVITLDRSGKVSFFNEAAEMLTDLAASRAMSLSFLRIFRKETWLVELIKKSFPPTQESARGEGDLV